MKIMELIIPFKKCDFSTDGTHLPSDKFIMEIQQDWEADFYNKFKPYYANAISGHPSAMLRLTTYMEAGEESNADFGMDLIDGEIDIDTNLAIEEFSDHQTVYAIGSQLHNDEDNPLFLIKNENLAEEILVLSYISDDDDDDSEIYIPVNDELVRKR